MFTRQYSRPVAIMVMVLCTLLWSMAGVMTRHLEAARSFEVTFWRSTFCAVFVVLALKFSGGEQALASLRRPSKSLLISGALWGVMFCCFMIALTLTSTSNTLVVSSASPLLTALLARFVLRTPITGATWFAIVMAVAGMAWIFSGGVAAGNPRDVLGMLIALSVPLASAINIITFKHSGHAVDLVPAVCLGAVFSALAMLPLAWPIQASAHDIGILAILGAFQLGLPCMLMVVASRSLSAPQISLLGLLEALFGPLWAWLGAGEIPTAATLQGGSVVIAALVLNELRQLRRT
ncbi:DMT family transporter [Uliginosibacterium gangwonense]|uniref:DMT family transporter n=1 Tax=Uliginosibacterium gangwonense TaxID=392736 RepID=UPI0003AB3B88|nr:DMT family transporter [Uliginosibacterium gangwonense]